MKICISMDAEMDLHSQTYDSLMKGIPRFLKILDKRPVKATFFVPARILEKFPEFFKNLKKGGHEIALHGLEHERFDDLSVSEKRKRIKESVKIYRNLFGENPSGFRAPQHSIDSETLKILSENGFAYDSSYIPFSFFQFLFFPRKIKHNFTGFFKSKNSRMLREGVVEFPISSVLVPFVSLPLRIFPKFLLRIYFGLLRMTHRNLVFYCHSWDLISLPDSKIDRNFSYKKFIDNFDYLINVLIKRDDFVLLKDFVHDFGGKNENSGVD